MLKSWFENHPGKFVAVLIGLFFSIVYLFFGFWDMLFVALLLSVAYQMGRKYDLRTLEADTVRFFSWLNERLKIF